MSGMTLRWEMGEAWGRGRPAPVVSSRSRSEVSETVIWDSPERIRTAVPGSKGPYAWPLHHGAIGPAGPQGYGTVVVL